MEELDSLSDVLPHAEFGEHHEAVIDAPIDTVWTVLRGLTWAELWMTRPLTAIRGLRDIRGNSFMTTLASSGVQITREPRFWAFAVIGKPWSPVPRMHPVGSVEEVRRFTEPGWLKYGMDWHLTALPDGRTKLETDTLCVPTDRRARLLFGCYWTAIRIGSGLIRRDMIAAVRRHAEGAAVTHRVGADALPTVVRAHVDLPTVDFCDTVETDAGIEATPEDWARAIFGDVPSPAESFVWRTVMRLRLAPRASASTIAGWRITGSGPDWIRMAAKSDHLEVRAVVFTAGDRAGFSTLVHYRRRAAGRMWAPVIPLHRRAVPMMLAEGVRRLRRQGQHR